MKKTLKMYVAPKAELIKMELQSVLCASGEQDLRGNVMDFTQKSGAWTND
jgi:hypothetical protein